MTLRSSNWHVICTNSVLSTHNFNIVEMCMFNYTVTILAFPKPSQFHIFYCCLSRCVFVRPYSPIWGAKTLVPILSVSLQFAWLCHEPETLSQVIGTVLPNLSIQFMLYKKYFCATRVSLHVWTYQQSERVPKNRFGPILLPYKYVITDIPLESFSQFFQLLFPSSLTAE